MCECDVLKARPVTDEEFQAASAVDRFIFEELALYIQSTYNIMNDYMLEYYEFITYHEKFSNGKLRLIFKNTLDNTNPFIYTIDCKSITSKDWREEIRRNKKYEDKIL